MTTHLTSSVVSRKTEVHLTGPEVPSMPVLLLYVGYMTVLGLKEYSNAPEFGQPQKQGRQRR